MSAKKLICLFKKSDLNTTLKHYYYSDLPSNQVPSANYETVILLLE